MTYDLVVRNGLVVDGSGMASFHADVGVQAGRIMKIGRIRERGRQEIDADGHIVTPGFIDGHTHMDAQIHWDPLGTSSSWNGVTSVVMGNCGFTIAPCAAKDAELVMMNLERAEDISRAAMAQGIKWSWETFPQYMDMLERLPKGINYATYIGHSALRTWAMGERAFEEESSASDLARMEGQLVEAMKAGAIGFSTSRSGSHETTDGRRVASRVASWDEVRHLVCAMGGMGGGIFELAKENATNSSDQVERREALDRMQALAVESGVVTMAGIQPSFDREAWHDQLAMLDRTAALGGCMLGQSHTRGVTVMTSFMTTLPFDRIPEWKEFRRHPLEEQKRLLRDPQVRAGLVHAAQHGDYGRAIGAEAKKPNWKRMRVLRDMVMPNPTIGELVAQTGQDPVDLMIELSLERDFNLFFVENTGVAIIEPEDLLQVMKHPRTIMTFSDSGAHVSQIADSSIQVHLLSYWTRERQAFTLEEAVRMVTFAPARAWGFHDRGMLREGMVADLNVIDYKNLAAEYPKVSYDLPAGARRLTQHSKGIHATVVAGQTLFRDGVHTGALPGQLLRGSLTAH
jgi:N-acyl-D-aspartate/D-glutamate deacylase